MKGTLDPVTVSVALAGVVFSPALADVVGPYAVIVLVSAIGAGWALGRRDEHTRINAAGYFALICGTAMAVSSNIADLIALWLSIEESRWLLSPIALVIGGVGHDWPRLIKWVALRALRIFERRAGGGGGVP